MLTWDDRVRDVAIAERKQRENDCELFEKIVRYLGDYQSEEIEGMERETLPDGREKGRKTWKGLTAFSFRVYGGKVIVHEGDPGPEATFDDVEPAYQRMAEHMLKTKQAAWAMEKAREKARAG